jgi:hypothetical protein
MLAGDDLTVVLFLWGLAVTVGIAAMDAAGWKHPYLTQSLFALAALFALAGVAWLLPIGEIIKIGKVGASIAGTLTALAESWWAWLAVVIVLGGTTWKYSRGIGKPLPFLRSVIGPRYISLREAALRLYERISRDAPTTDRVLTDQEVLMTYASIILRFGPVHIFGKRPPSREFREIPKADYENLFVGPEATTLQRAVLSDKPVFTDVAILTRDYRKHVATMQLDPAEWPIH